MNESEGRIHYRLLTKADVDRVPLQHQGSREEVLQRIEALGSSAMLAFEGDRHVGQLQFRLYVPNTISPAGLMDPLYWMDFEGRAPSLPDRTLALFCYHVGQLDDTDARDSRYFGRGIGTRLLEDTLAWMADAGVQAVIAKGLPAIPPVPQFMGGLPASSYLSRGFEAVARYRDANLRVVLNRMLKGLYGIEFKNTLQAGVSAGVSLDEASEIAICVKRFK